MQLQHREKSIVKGIRKLIISASRRTDIPAFYSEWFMNRIREGYCYVPNPMNTHQVARVPLKPEDVEIIVFWSKNPAPMIPKLSELKKRGFSFYFQFTLNNYPLALEPGVPTLEKRLETFRILSNTIGATGVVWRYDPIIISNYTSYEFHQERFTYLAEELKGYTQRVMISMVDFYRKTDRRLSILEKEEGYQFKRDIVDSEEMHQLLRFFSEIANKNNIEIFTCAEEKDYSKDGVPPGKCIDDEIIRKLNKSNLKYKKDPAQRESCLCMISKDIGINETCMHGCQYCYATTNNTIAERRNKEHDPLAPALWGKIDPQNVIIKDVEQADFFQLLHNKNQ
jgi:DNA repair photolyase